MLSTDMSRTLAFSLSVLAGLILWLAQLEYIIDWPSSEHRIIGVRSRDLIRLCVISTLTFLVAISIHALETRLERSPYRKYRLLREDIYLVLSHWRDDFLSKTRRTKRRTRTFHQEMIKTQLRSLARTLDKGLPGAEFQISVMVPCPENQDQLTIGYACRSDAGQMISFTQGKQFSKGEGYCGTAWYEMAPQTGNGRRRWLILKDPRYEIQRPEGYRDEDKSYFAVPIPAPVEQNDEILGILSIDSTNANHFPRSNKNAIFLKRLFTPVLGILAYHLEEAKKH